MISFILNLIWSLLGLAVAIISLPTKIGFESIAEVLVTETERLWIGEIFLRRKIKGMTFGNLVLLSKAKDELTLKHELAHVRQYNKMPFIFPFLYCFEVMRSGYERNKYDEAARRN
jgi:hypothetical protein